MIKLKGIISESSDSIDILKYGLLNLYKNTHIIKNQLSDNIDIFFNAIDINTFENKLGKIKKFLGAGVFGAAYLLYNNKVLKLTFDFTEAPFLWKYCYNKPTDGFVKIDNIYKIHFGKSVAYIIIRDRVEPIDYSKAQIVINDFANKIRNKMYSDIIMNKIAIALNSMYELDSNWRGTHAENIGIQNNNIVLYDGFSKNIKLHDSNIPFLDLSVEISE